MRAWLSLAVTLAMCGSVLAATAGPASSSSNVKPIPAIQGEGHISPYVDGPDVTTQGVVTATPFRGLYVQDPVGDGNDATSDALVLFDFALPGAWAVGDCVELTGAVSENIGGGAATGNLSTTQMAFPTITAIDCVAAFGEDYEFPAPVVIGLSGRIPPAEITISTDELPVNLQDVPGLFDPEEDAIDFYEAMEGMRVQIEDAVAVSATRQFNSFSAEFFTLPNQGDKAIIEPDDARSSRGGILLQSNIDGTGDLNPERVQVQLDPNLYPDAIELPVKVGDLVGNVTGVLGYSFGNFEVNATESITIDDQGLAEETTSIRPRNGRLTVASYNVLNLSVGDVFDDEGIDDVAQFAELGSQIANNLKAPDVIALQEIQDDSGETDDRVVTADATLAQLIQSIADAGGPTYMAFDVDPVDNTQGGVPGGNIRNAFLYNPARVDLLGYTALDSGLLAAAGADPASFDGTRIPLVGLFEFDGARFTVISVHNSSRFGSTPIFGGPQPFVQAGEVEREAQSKALNSYVDFLLQGDEDAQIIVTGDFNTFEFTDELVEDLPGPEPVLTNLVPVDDDDHDGRDRDDDDDHDGRDRDDDNDEDDEDDEDKKASEFYSFIFDGNSQMLDHMFVTDNLEDKANFDVVHVNVDFPRTFNDVTGSDHEPIVGQFRLEEQNDTKYTLSVLHNNDGESQLIDAGSGLEDFGGVARFATVVADAKADAESCDAGGKQKCGSILVSSGDNFLAGPEFNASVELGTWFDAVALDMLGYDAIQLGNHDFDFGPDVLAAFISEGFTSPGTPPYIGANLDFTGEPALQALADSGVIVNSTVVREDREDFGIVGVVTPNLPFISSPGATVVDPNLAAVVQAEVDALLASGIEKIIFISHLQGIDEDIALAAMVDGIDVMVAGGGDELLARPTDALIPGDVPFGHYPQLATDINGTIIPVVTTAGSYGYLGDLEVDWDRHGNVVSWSGGPIRVAGGAEPDAVASDPVFQSDVVDPVADFLAVLGTTEVAQTEVGLDAIREHIRSVETNEGNLIADAYFSQATASAPSFGLPTPDVALTNGGGIRNDNILPPGPLTALDTFDMLPFANFVTIVPGVTRDEFKALIEQAVSAVNPDGTAGSGRFAQVSHFTVEYDSSAAPGSRVTRITVDGIIGDIVLDGAVVAGPDLTVATNAFSAGGGDNWFGGPPGDTGRVSLGVTDQQALQNFLEGPLAGLVTASDYPADAGPAGSCAGARITNTAAGCVNQF